MRARQTSFFKIDWKHAFQHGGVLRQKRKGRRQRPLSCSAPLHVVFKVNRSTLVRKSLRDYKNFALIQKIVKRYSKRFFIKVEQISIQADHIHCLIRTSRRSQAHYFFRVTSGQIAQQFHNQELLRSLGVTDTPRFPELPKIARSTSLEVRKARKEKIALWKYRPFSRVVKGWKAYRVVRDYIQLNEKEARGEIRYRSTKLRGLSLADWQVLWT